MFKKNEGNLDRILRFVIGAALILGYFLNGDGANSWLYLLGVIPLATGLVGSCPLYSIFGLSTCPLKRG